LQQHETEQELGTAPCTHTVWHDDLAVFPHAISSAEY